MGVKDALHRLADDLHLPHLHALIDAPDEPKDESESDDERAKPVDGKEAE